MKVNSTLFGYFYGIFDIFLASICFFLNELQSPKVRHLLMEFRILEYQSLDACRFFLGISMQGG